MSLLGVQLPSRPITFRVKSRDEGAEVKDSRMVLGFLA